MTHFAYQLYCSRNFPPLADTLKMLAAAGYTEVEGYGGLFDDLPALKDALDANGLRMTTSHIGLDMVEKTPDIALDIIQTLGMKAAFIPYVMPADRPTDADGWRAFGARLARAGEPIVSAGITYGWHNHDFELIALPTGELPLDLLLDAAPDLKLELDLGWVARAGKDPVAIIDTYAGRLAAVHVKDVAAPGENTAEDGWADVGHGTQDWAAIHAALQRAGVDRYVIEHDNPTDHQRFATRSLATLQAL